MDFRYACVRVLTVWIFFGQVDLAETDESENENGNENEQGKGRQEGSHCGIGRRSCKLLYRAK